MSGLTLEVVKKAFAQWRYQRTSRFESTPQKLYPKYKKTVICRRLRLSGSQLKLHLDSSSSSDSGFVLASVDSVNEHLSPNI